MPKSGRDDMGLKPSRSQPVVLISPPDQTVKRGIDLVSQAFFYPSRIAYRHAKIP